jgi:hypothetical protein
MFMVSVGTKSTGRQVAALAIVQFRNESDYKAISSGIALYMPYNWNERISAVVA